MMMMMLLSFSNIVSLFCHARLQHSRLFCNKVTSSSSQLTTHGTKLQLSFDNIHIFKPASSHSSRGVIRVVIFDLSKSEIAGSDPVRELDVCMQMFCVVSWATGPLFCPVHYASTQAYFHQDRRYTYKRNIEARSRNRCCHRKAISIIYTGCPRRNVPDFGRVFLMLKYTDITQNTYVQS